MLSSKEDVYDALDLIAIKELKHWCDKGYQRSFSISYDERYHDQWRITLSSSKATNFGMSGNRIHRAHDSILADSYLLELMSGGEK